MTVTRVLRILIISLIFLSCSTNNTSSSDEEDIYRIISKLTSRVKEQSLLYPTFPPPPSKAKYTFTTKDSLMRFKRFYEQYKGKKIIAFDQIMFNLPESIKIDLIDCQFDSKSFIRHSIRTKTKNGLIDVNKLFISNKDSLLIYGDSLKNKLDEGFHEIDFLLSFSEIMFNDDYDKAVLIVNVKFEKLDSFSTIIYLEKKHYHWKIVCEEVLNIS